MVEDATTNIESGAVAARDTATQFGEIVQSVSKAADLLGEIALASREQAQGVEQINRGLEQVDHVTQSNTASAEEGAAAAQELSAQSQRLKSLVGRFSLGDSGRAGRRDDGASALGVLAVGGDPGLG
jgi:methyl-accepting chemotaxis protein